MRLSISTLIAGMLFGAGLAVGGLTDPQTIVSFLDFTGDWNPTILYVMASAIAINSLVYALVEYKKQKNFSPKPRKVFTKLKKPILTDKFMIPSNTVIDKNLIIGAALYGIGWGLSGYCPGPAIISVFDIGMTAGVFILFLIVGMKIHTHIYKRLFS